MKGRHRLLDVWQMLGYACYQWDRHTQDLENEAKYGYTKFVRTSQTDEIRWSSGKKRMCHCWVECPPPMRLRSKELSRASPKVLWLVGLGANHTSVAFALLPFFGFFCAATWLAPVASHPRRWAYSMWPTIWSEPLIVWRRTSWTKARTKIGKLGVFFLSAHQ